MYKEMYLLLFNEITTVLKEDDICKIKNILIKAQQSAEEICIESNEKI